MESGPGSETLKHLGELFALRTVGQNGVGVNDKIYSFGPFELSADERVLRQAENIVPIPPKAMAALLVLVEAEGRVVSKADLISQVWPDTFVEEGTLAQTVSILRRQLTIDKQAESPIETISRVGYRVRIPITVTSSDAQPELLVSVESSEAGVVELDTPLIEAPSLQTPFIEAPILRDAGFSPAAGQRRLWLFPALGLLLLILAAGCLLLPRFLKKQPAKQLAACEARVDCSPAAVSGHLSA